MTPPAGLLTSLSPGSRILFIRLRSLGDTVLSTPLYAALKAWRPDLRLSALVEEPFDEALYRNPDLESVFPLQVHRTKQRSTARSSLADAAADPPNALRLLHQPARRLHQRLAHRPERGPLSHRPAGLSQFLLLQRSHGVAVAAPRGPVATRPGFNWNGSIDLGLQKGPDPPARLVPDPGLRSVLEARLRDAGLPPSRPVCVIQPSSRFHTKEWTDAGFAEISDFLQGYGYATLLVGTQEEKPKIRRVAGLCRNRPASIWGLTISELTGVLDQASLFVGNDSGPTHMAAALGVPVLVLFGSSDSHLWRPLGSRP